MDSDEMNDARYEELKSIIRPLFEKWTEILGLRWWNIDVVYHRTSDDFVHAFRGRQENPKATAMCSCSWEYGDASVSINMERMDNLDMKVVEIESVVVHELCHCLVHEMREWGPEEMDSEDIARAMKHEERVVTGLQKAFNWVWKNGYEAGKGENAVTVVAGEAN